MNQDTKIKLKSLLVQHESCKLHPYTDTTGHLTIGVGRNLTDRGISKAEALYLLDDDIDYFSNKLSSTLKFFDQMDEARKIALIDMCFNLGFNGLMGFTHMMFALELGDYERAADEMLNSEWHNQVKGRAETLAKIMRSGELNN